MSVISNPTASQQNMKKIPILNFFSFIAGVVDMETQIFVKFWNGPNGILRGPGETDSWKNLK
jgi:hypothetical protein